jgi:hypothetical protein
MEKEFCHKKNTMRLFIYYADGVCYPNVHFPQFFKNQFNDVPRSIAEGNSITIEKEYIKEWL